MKRLSGASGQIADSNAQESDANDKIVRNAILVHGGPEGKPVTFASGDGKVDFDDERIQRVVDNQNEKIMSLANQYGGLDKMPLGAFDPILDQHDNDSNDRVRGRLASVLKFERRDVPGVGKNVACATAYITFLGQDTVSRVKDGRIYHLSIGIVEETDTLGEVSTVIEPAAPGAMLLASGKKVGGKLKTLSKGRLQMSLKLKRLQRHTERMTKLAAIDSELTALSKKSGQTKELVTLSGKQRGVTSRLQKLMSDFKLTPVEFKKLDITRLAKMDKESLDMVLSAYEARPKVESAQRGTTEAAEFGEIAKGLEKRQMKRLEAEIKGDFKRLSGKKMKLKGEDDSMDDKEHGDTYEMKGGNKETDDTNPGKDDHVVPGQAGDEEQLKHFAACMSKMKAHLEKGDVEGAKAAHAEMEAHVAKHGMKHMAAPGVGVGDVKSEDEKQSLETLQGQVDEIHTNMARLAGMVKELMGSEKDEGHDLAKGMKDEVKEDAGVEDDGDEVKPGDKAS